MSMATLLSRSNELRAESQEHYGLNVWEWHGFVAELIEIVATIFPKDGLSSPFITNLGIRGRPVLTNQLTAMRQQFGVSYMPFSYLNIKSLGDPSSGFD
jgi:hypothetical protein